MKVPLDPPPRPPLPKLGDGVALLRADAPEIYDAIDDATVTQRSPALCGNQPVG